MSLRVAVLCADDAHHHYLVRTLEKEGFEIAALLVEPGAEQIRRIRSARRWNDYFHARYHAWRRRVTGLTAYRRNYFEADGLGGSAWERRTTVTSINDALVAETLRRARHDVAVVMGTTILRKRTLKAAGPRTLNIHGGYLPDYRGNHCFFFACFEGRFDRVGSTIHLVEAGVDTGAVVEVVTPPIFPEDTPETLYCRAEKMAIHRLVEWLRHLERDGDIPSRPQGIGGRQFRTRDRKLWHDLLFWLRRASGVLRFPTTAPRTGRE
jgi:methionyl-tRNA formyltransferase